ncbi:uncharacterized protein [Rutidosis leptorrhynchoides]|uniref:uncharacterized protein n=1 Tax=Rutidosis leptorrhynchoides TaxID=125765 RepID=UPI003A99185C
MVLRHRRIAVVNMRSLLLRASFVVLYACNPHHHNLPHLHLYRRRPGGSSVVFFACKPLCQKHRHLHRHRIFDPEKHHIEATSATLTNLGRLSKGHFNRTNEAKKQEDWNTLIKDASLAISAGADFALQAYSVCCV